MARSSRLASCMAAFAAGLCTPAFAADPVAEGFRNPPVSARPQVWWHWLNGNVSKDGIKADLEWMKRVGVGGVQQFEASLGEPPIGPRLIYMSPEWKDAFKYTAGLVDGLGLDMTIASSPGWSGAGASWVQPAQAMKKLVWTETPVEGGRKMTATLPRPPSGAGPIGNAKGAREGGPALDFYADSLVIAYRAPSDERPLNAMARITASGPIDAAKLSDGDIAGPVKIAPGADGLAWLRFDFPTSQTVRAVTYATDSIPPRFGGRPADSGRVLQVSDDGEHFRTLATPPLSGSPRHTMAFPAVTARAFRLIQTTPPGKDGLTVTELTLEGAARINQFEEKAAFATALDYSLAPTPAAPPSGVVNRGEVIDLTARMTPDGRLDWTPPPGRWVVVRLGYSLTGAMTNPSPAEATGLEIDKLSKPHVAAFIGRYLQSFADTTGPDLFGARGLGAVLMDSWESGTQNWTETMLADFQRLRGYDPRPWTPVLTGRVVESAEASEKFLWDYRRTIGDLVSENYFGEVTRQVHARGLKVYGEAHESGRATIGDGMEFKARADFPMGAMWTGAFPPGAGGVRQPPTPNRTALEFDLRESASVANLYGQKIVAAESMTSNGAHWAFSPWLLKPTADLEMLAGVNRFSVHTSVHQPMVDGRIPGLTLAVFGQDFTRNETWADQAGAWISYLARSSYVLQQGRAVADVAYFYGEDAPVTALFAGRRPDAVDGYNYDFVNARALIDRLSVTDGRLTAPTGASYRLLYLDRNARLMSLPVLRKIQALVRDGAVVVGPKPVDTPSLSDDPAEFRRIADLVWTGEPGAKGRVYDRPLAEVLSTLAAPDFTYDKAGGDLRYLHRRLADGDVYYVSNRANAAATLKASFRATGHAPELWDPATGLAADASYQALEGRTDVDLSLNPYESVFVVFRKAASARTRIVAPPARATIAELKGPWPVRFQTGRGAPDATVLPELASWAASADPGVRYFSGVGSYSRDLAAPKGWFQPGARLWLDLGDVQNIAEVAVNGRSLGVAWKPPFQVDVTDALRPGANRIEIKVANLWVNRMVGDQQPGAAAKITWTPTVQPFDAKTPLLASGLLGPVRLIRETSTPPQGRRP